MVLNSYNYKAFPKEKRLKKMNIGIEIAFSVAEFRQF